MFSGIFSEKKKRKLSRWKSTTNLPKKSKKISGNIPENKDKSVVFGGNRPRISIFSLPDQYIDFPFTPVTSDLRVRVRFGERYNEMNIRKIELTYKKI